MLVVAMNKEELMLPPMVSWWSSVQHAHTQKKIFLMIGRRLAHYCMLIFVLFVLQLIFLRFLYTLYIAIDANFKLKGKQCHLDNVELMPGWCAYVPEMPYQTHIANNVDQPKVHTQYICQSKITSHHIPTDQYLWIPTWHTSPSSNSFVTWICSFRCSCDLFETLYDMEKWQWQSSKGQKVCDWLICFISLG